MHCKFSKYVKKMEHNDKVILFHSKTGKWIRMSKMIYQIIVYGVEKTDSIEGLYDELYDDSDKEFIKKIYSDLTKLKILVDKEENYDNSSVIFELTRKCNLQCKHCCINADNTLYEGTDLDTSSIIRILSNFIEINPYKITLTGGEPLLRKDFFSILKYLRKKYNGKISVMTNGTLIDKDNVKKLVKYINQIDISLDGIDEETCSLIRGKGVFEKVLKAVNLLKENDFNNISLSITIGDKNMDWEEKFLELNSFLNTRPIIRSFTPVGRGEANGNLFYDNKINENLEQNFSEKLLSLEYTKKFTPCTCNAGVEKICVDYKGDIYPCQWFFDDFYKIGNALKDNLKEINNLSIIEKLANYYPDKFYLCKKCDVNSFCWPCPGELMFYSHNINEFQNLCKRMKPILYKNVWGE